MTVNTRFACCCNPPFIAVFVIAWCGIASCPAAQAAPINLSFTGEIETLNPAIYGTTVGESFTLSYEYDTVSAVGSDVDDSTRAYVMSAQISSDMGFSVDVSSLIGSGSPDIDFELTNAQTGDFEVYIQNDVDLGNSVVADVFGIRFLADRNSTGLNLATVDLGLVDTTASIFSDRSLPSTLDLNDFDQAWFSIVLNLYAPPPGGYTATIVEGEITALVPEPSGIWLAVAGGIVLFCAACRRGQAQRKVLD